MRERKHLEMERKLEKRGGRGRKREARDKAWEGYSGGGGAYSTWTVRSHR